MGDPAVCGFLAKLLLSRGGCAEPAELLRSLALSEEQLRAVLRDAGPERFLLLSEGPPDAPRETVLVLSPARVCVRRECRGCPRLHLCKSHLGGWCRVRACKYNHDIFSEENRKVLKKFELTGLNEDELRVLLLQNDPFLLPDTCKAYNKRDETCPLQDNCPKLHICNYFIRGECRFPQCKRSHNLMNPIALQLLLAEGVDDKLAWNIQRICEQKTLVLFKETRLQRGGKPMANVQRVNFGAGKHRNHKREQTCDNPPSVDFTFGTENLLIEKSRAKPTAIVQGWNFASGNGTEPKHEQTSGNATSANFTFGTETIVIENSGLSSKPRLLGGEESDRPGTGDQKESKTENASIQKPEQVPMKAPLLDLYTSPKQAPVKTPLLDLYTSPKQDPVKTLLLDPYPSPKQAPVKAPLLDLQPSPKQAPVKAPLLDLQPSPKQAPAKAPLLDLQPSPKQAPVKAPLLDLQPSPKQDPVKAPLPDLHPILKQTPVKTPLPDLHSSPNQAPAKTSLPDLHPILKQTPVKTPLPDLHPNPNKAPAKTPLPILKQTPMKIPLPDLYLSPEPVSLKLPLWTASLHPQEDWTFLPDPDLSPKQVSVKSRLLDPSLGSGAKVSNPFKPAQNVEKKKIDEICLHYLWRFCKNKNNCDMDHFYLPYRWQIHSGVEWKDCTNMEEIEKAFCDPSTTSFPAQNINFNTMLSYVNPVRRLSTPSSITQPANFVLTTKWLWHWKNDKGQWIEYGKPDGHRPGSNLSSDDLENVFLSDPNGSMQFQAGSQIYEIHFKDMIQRNIHFLTQRELRRRPKFVSAEDVKKKKGHADPATASGSTSERNYPKEWDKSALPDIGYKALEVSKMSSEFTTIEKLFQKTMKNYVVHKIRRIQNPSLWQVFQWQKDQMKKRRRGGDVEEKLLFHGTSSPSVLEAICNENFDWRICGTNGTVYGKGSYFARDAEYSHSFCQRDAKVKTMFVAQVLVGDFVTGHATYNRPPAKPGNAINYYDSCVDRLGDPSIFVIFEKHQIYPAYMVDYGEEEKKCIIA